MNGLLERGRHYLRADGRATIPVGAHVVPPAGPDWPWRVGPEAFERAFAGMAALGLDAARIDLLWAAIEPEPGIFDERHLRVLDQVLDHARSNGIRLHPTLFTGGEVGDAYWDVPWRAGRHPHADPEMRRLQAAHAAMLGRRWRDDPALLAWDLADEPPLWLFRDTTDDDARAWTADLAAALRSADPGHLVTVGTASQEIGWGPFRADVVADALDVACVHPYPIYSPELYPDSLLATRMTHAAAFETALAAGAGRPVMLHEYGASSAQFDPERIAEYDRLLAWSSLGRGAIGFFAWCWTDAEPAAFERAPYVRQAHETQFGVTEWDGTLRPRGRILGELAATVRGLPLDALAGNGPVASVAIPVPHEFVRPYDPASFGLDDAPAGIYVPAERAWTPTRDPHLLVAAWLNGFVLAARAGLTASFPRERLDGRWPDARLVLLPAPLAATSSSLHHVRTSWWSGAADHFARGGSAWVSCSADVAIPEMASILGARVVDRAAADVRPVLRFVLPWGPFAVGDELALPSGDAALACRSVVLAPAAGSRVIAVDASGEPALIVADRGAGRVVVCAHPVELLLARQPDAHGPADRSWGLYAGLAAATSTAEPAAATDPDVTTGLLAGPVGALLAVTNHGPQAIHATIRLPRDIVAVRRFGTDGPAVLPFEPGATSVALEPHGAAIIGWDHEEGRR
jgi:hypothetical protein